METDDVKSWRPILNRPIMCLAVVTALLSFHSTSAACSLAGCLNDGDEMRPSFTITVTHDDRPLAGVSFHIVGKGAEQFSGITDDRGTIHVQELAPGLYWLSGDLLGTGVVHTCFHVSAKPSKTAKSKLPYAWGDEAPATSRIAGILVDSQPGKGGTPIWNLVHRMDVPVASAELRLQDPITHAVYTTRSDQQGKFSFEALPSGTYVLHIEGGSAGERAYDATDETIKLASSANFDWLLFKTSEAAGGSCGGTELELQKQPT
jgi:hypothetical protein